MSHEVLIPLLMGDEQKRRNKWFSGIMKYSHTFKEDVIKWLSEPDESQQNDILNPPHSETAAINEEVLPCSTEDEPQVLIQPVSTLSTEEMQDNIKPSDSVSNVGSKNSGSR